VIVTLYERETVKPRIRRRDYLGAGKRERLRGDYRIANANPCIVEGGRVTVNIEGVLEARARHCEFQENFATRAESGRRWRGERKLAAEELSERLSSTRVLELECA
jgi:hypothetical protein